MRPPVTGVTGKARSGKDTVVNFLIAAAGGYPYSFAGPIKTMLSAGFGIHMADPYWQAHKEDPIPAFGKSPRQMMQTLGTEWGRNLVHPDVWLLLAKQKLLEKGPGMVISDVRFENEAAWVRKVGGMIIHVQRDALAVNPHSSEAGVEVAASDAIINNFGTLEELQERVKDLVDFMK